jgi:hypothetical protein
LGDNPCQKSQGRLCRWNEQILFKFWSNQSSCYKWIWILLAWVFLVLFGHVHLELTINTMLCPVHMMGSTVLLDTLICKKEETLLKNQLELLVNIMELCKHAWLLLAIFARWNLILINENMVHMMQWVLSIELPNTMEEVYYTTNWVMSPDCVFHKVGEWSPGTGDVKDISYGQKIS